MFQTSSQIGDVPVSAGLLQSLAQAGAVTIHGLADAWNMQPHSIYPYLTDRDMRYGQMRTLYRRARDPRIQAAFHADLMAGTGWTAIFIDAELDIDGDGDVDSDDVLTHAIDALRNLSDFLVQVQASDGCPNLAALAHLKQRVLQGVVTAERCAQQIADAHDNRRGRRKARPINQRSATSDSLLGGGGA